MSVQLSTILTRSPAALSSIISRLSKTYPGYPLLFALSHNIPSQELSGLVNELTSFSSQTAGCLSAPLPVPNYESLISCSLAVLDPAKSVLFRSAIPGRAVPQVGRWHAFRNKNEAPHAAQMPVQGPIRWADVWENNAQSVPLPPGLQSLNDAGVSEVIYFSDRSPEGFLNSLNAFPNATRLGLLASSTPFITGRPVTLFHKGSVFDTGAVGFALKQGLKARPMTDFPGIVPLSGLMSITRSEGNMIISLEGSNPTQLLLNTLQKGGVHLDSSVSFKYEDSFLLGTIDDGKVTRMYTITAGDPVRGSISLESHNAPIAGTKVQLFHRPESAFPSIPAKSLRNNTLQFLICPETSPSISLDDRTSRHDAEGNDMEILSSKFLAASENGFVMSRPWEAAWTCSVIGGSAALEWSSS